LRKKKVIASCAVANATATPAPQTCHGNGISTMNISDRRSAQASSATA
jgi:hypothetical protein